MSVAALRIQGVYQQAQPGLFMLRAKLPGGVLQSSQGHGVCTLAEGLGDGTLHLTTRMSLEVHGLREGDLPRALKQLRATGLSSRGACGGAVRGVAVNTDLQTERPRLRILAARIQQHFTGHRKYEALPKKFKIGIDSAPTVSRHLIQDVGLVHAGDPGGAPAYDVWLAGGLGRAPQEAFLYRRAVPEAEVLTLIEAVVGVYGEHASPGSRLKHLVAGLGREEFLHLLERERRSRTGANVAALRASVPSPENAPTQPSPVPVRVFCGQLPAAALRGLCTIAADHGLGRLLLTPQQDIAIPVRDTEQGQAASAAAATLGFDGRSPEQQVRMAVCPGNHECRLGLAPTREVARRLIGAMGPGAQSRCWAVSGCPNSCAQPQLADLGVLCSRLAKDESDQRTPLFDLMRRENSSFGKRLLERASLPNLIATVRELG